MNIVGCIIFWIFAAIFYKAAKNSVVEKEDFSKYPVSEGTVIGTHDYRGKRWMVEFIGPDGKKVIGADHILSVGTFHPEKYTLPKRGNSESFYYWEHNRKNSRLTINNKPVLYYIHFCNEDFYTLIIEQYQRNRKCLFVASAVLFLLGIAILIFG
ncbi:MAG: hypothetical protein J6V36_02210 [Clostridia bacterium]|nr:hypothetical protein [Clostridia bacterium]